MAAKEKGNERDTASWMYCELGMTLTAIMERLSIPMKTLSKWKNKPRKGELPWDERKRIHQSSPSKIKETILLEMEAVLRGEKPKVNTQDLCMLASSLEKIEKKISPQVTVSVIMMLENFAAQDNPEEAVRMLEMHKRFILHVIKQNG